MTRKVFYEDSYLKTLTATVSAIDGEWIELDQTIFYPEGGGQPGDTGTLATSTPGKTGKFLIAETRKGDGPDSIRHRLDSDAHGLGIGDVVYVALDWDRRYRHMRMHTGMHLLGSLIPVPVTGGSVGAEKSRLDFDVGELELDKIDLTRRMNALILEAHDIRFESITDEELDANPGLVRTMSVQPPRGAGVIRMVRVKDVDFQPCGGTHINNTSEIGTVAIAKIENKGKRNRRVHLVFS